MIIALLVLTGVLEKPQGICAAEEVKTEEEIIEGIEAYRNSIVHIESKCWDGKEKVYRSRSFSGFVVSKDSSGIYIVTVCDGLTYTSEEKEEIETEYELENNNNISEQIEVVFNGDLRVAAGIVEQSEQRNLTILKLNQNINFENAISFAKKNVSDKERVFLLSYPEFEKSQEAIYSAENVKIEKGTVTGLYKKSEIVFLRHDIKADSDSIGGPLLNDDGMVVGLLLRAKEKKSGAAVSGSEIKAFLDTFNVSYTEQEEKKEEKKFPIIQAVLGIIILILAVQVFLQVRKNHENSDREEEKKQNRKDKYSARTVRDESLIAAKTQGRKRKNSGVKVNARLEYPAEKRGITMQKATFVIGRAKEADFILAESQGISRKHACIQFDGKYFYLTDLKSTNHTFLNGSELKPGEKRVLKDGDEIMVAKERLIFRKG